MRRTPIDTKGESAGVLSARTPIDTRRPPSPLVGAAALATLVFSVGSLLVAACGEIIPLEAQACPCTSGWTCCDAVCVQGSSCPAATADAGALCSGTIALGTQFVPSEEDAGGSPSVQTVMGHATSLLEPGAAVPFDYATSLWPLVNGWVLNGWYLNAAPGDQLSFRLWAEQDAGTVPLDLAVYGPLEGIGTKACSAALASDGPMSGAEIQWTAPAGGTYLAAPYHAVTETAAGLAYQALNDGDYAHAFIVLGAATTVAH